MLAAAGVLEFVDQQMADAVGNGQRGFGGKAVLALSTLSAICATSMKSAAAASAKTTLQLARRVTKQA